MICCILLVEDNADNAAVYRMILEHGGYEVHHAVDGLEALRLARETNPALILLDLSLPGIDGWSVFEQLREGDGTSTIPVIALTAHAFEADRIRAEEAGFDGYLTKPIEPRRVLEEVTRYLGREGGAPSS